MFHAINAIIKSIMRHRKVKHINIGYGKCITKNEQLVKRETKYLNPIYGSIPLRKHEPLKKYPNIKKAKKLNWFLKFLYIMARKTILFTNLDYKFKIKNLNLFNKPNINV